LLARFASLFRRRALDRQLDEELRFHLDMETEANRRRGMNARDASLAARREFGGVAHTQEMYRDRRGLPMLELFFRDLAYGFRTLRRSPGFTAIAVLSLSLGIGANTAIFTLIDAVMLRSLPVKAPEQLVSIGDASRPSATSTGPVYLELSSYPIYRRLRDENSTFGNLMASGRLDGGSVRIDGGAAEPVRGRFVTANYFDVLGVVPIRGRAFLPATDEGRAQSPEAVISYDYWERRFARDPAILGRTLSVNGAALSIVGVAPRGFMGEVVGIPAEVWIPMSMKAAVNPGYEWFTKNDIHWLLLMGRLRPGVSIAAAREQIRALVLQATIDLASPALSADDVKDLRQMKVLVEPCARGFSAMRPQISRSLVIMMFVVGMVLLIACANVANLQLARAANRRKEISVRIAIGAGRARLVRQLLTESSLLAAVGGLLGLAMAYGGSLLLLYVTGPGNTANLDIRPNGAILAFTAGVSLLTGILFGITPALRSTRVDLSAALKESSRGVTASRGWQLGKLLVVGQVALSLLLLVGAGLFLRSLRNLEAKDVGYARENLVVLRVDPTASGYPIPQQLPLARRLLEHLQSTPGLNGVTVSENGIFGSTDSGSDGLQVEGFQSTRPQDLTASVDQIGPAYFHVVGVPLVAGREFDEHDAGNSPPVTIINQTMARFYFGNRDPVGRHIIDGGTSLEIVGVARDMKERSLKAVTERRYYLPYYQISGRIYGFNFEMRTRGDATQMIAAIRRETQAFDPNLKIMNVSTVSSLIDNSIGDERLVAQLCTFFSALALLLAATGLYGVMAYAMSRRASELALRIALGAARSDVVSMVLRETLVLVGAGIAIGLPAALLAARFISNSLANVSASDPATLAASTLVLLVVALTAGWIPAHRASHIDPVVVLREE
jgi:predicted permease